MPGRIRMRGATQSESSGSVMAPPDGGQLGTRYQMRERLLAFGNDFYIQTATGQRAFLVDGKALRVRDTLLFKDMRGNEVYKIQEKVARIRDTMTIYRGNQRAAIVKKAMITPLRDRYSIDIPGASGLSAQGNILQHEYRIERDHGGPVATASKRWFRVRDTYGVDIAPGQDDLLILAVTVCIDAMSSVG